MTYFDSDSISIKEKKWNQWLAGVIDGDGYLAIQKNNVAICEITMPLQDEYLLLQIKQRLGGNVRLRSGAKALRYRLAHKIGIKELLCRINGNIRNSIRILQFQKLCVNFNILFLPAAPLTTENAYTAGFFDADGTIYLSATSSKLNLQYSTQSGILGKINRLFYSRGSNQLLISISNKYRENVEIFKGAFKLGTIREIQHKDHVWYSWDLSTPQDILVFLDYSKRYSLKSYKSKRFYLVERYFELKQVGAHLAPEGTQLNRAWFLFCQKWYLG